jgi:hypothetical protein
MADRRGGRDQATLWYAALLRSNPTIFATEEDGITPKEMGFDSAPTYLMLKGVPPAHALNIVGRYFHAVQVDAVATGTVLIEVSFDGVTFYTLATITTAGVTQLTSGLYRLIRARYTGAVDLLTAAFEFDPLDTVLTTGANPVGLSPAFAASGSAFLDGDPFDYTGVSGTGFTGVTGLVKDYPIGATVQRTIPKVTIMSGNRA